MEDPRAPEHLINFADYPVHDLEAPRTQARVADYQAQLEMDGALSLPGFLTPEGARLLADDGEALAPLAYGGPTEASPYFFNYDLARGQPEDHPTRRTNERRLAQVATDLIPEQAALKRLFRWQPLADFLARILKLPALYPSADPYQALNISIMEEGGRQQWHFDHSAFVITLMAQPAEEGGVFEYVPNIRADDDEHFDDVRSVMSGQRDRVRTLQMSAGTLNLFKGHYSLHRVTPVGGNRRRIQCILGYKAEPDQRGSLKSSLLHYGPRVAIKEGLSPAERDAILA